MSSFRSPQTIIRQDPGQYVDGVWVDGESIEFTIMASVQPASMEDLINLPVGRRLSDFVKAYTSTEIFPVSEGEVQRQPDRLLWRGHTYEATQVGVRQMGVIDHYKVIFTKVSQ